MKLAALQFLNQKYFTVSLVNIDSLRQNAYLQFVRNNCVLVFALFIAVTGSYAILMSSLKIARNKGLRTL
jgi:hypothetical protein